MSSPVALITGASRGIGRATVIALAARGYRLALIARSEPELARTARLAKAPDALLIAADISKADDCRRAIDRAMDRFTRLDAIAHIAGLAPVVSIADMTVEQWHATLDTNLSAAFYLTRFAWPHLKLAAQSAGHAAVVYVSSLASRDPFPGFGAYAAAKAGLNLLALSAAREGQPHQITAHAVAPGAVETEMFRRILSHEQYPTEKTLAPEEVARVIAQCITGDLRHTSGEVIYLHKAV